MNGIDQKTCCFVLNYKVDWSFECVTANSLERDFWEWAWEWLTLKHVVMLISSMMTTWYVLI